jgi:hypothetical protein
VKALSRAQLESRKEKAVRFARDVLGDPDRAGEIAEESLEDYAERRKIQITNPSKRGNAIVATKQELEDRVEELEQENQDLQDTLDAVADLVSPEEGEDDDDRKAAADDDEEDDDQD